MHSTSPHLTVTDQSCCARPSFQRGVSDKSVIYQLLLTARAHSCPCGYSHIFVNVPAEHCNTTLLNTAVYNASSPLCRYQLRRFTESSSVLPLMVPYAFCTHTCVAGVMLQATGRVHRRDDSS
jgi:hypothetical protein